MSRVRRASAAAVVLAAALAPPGAARAEERVLALWLGPGVRVERGAGAFGDAGGWGLGPAFRVTAHRAGGALGVRLDAGLVSLDGPQGEVAFTDTLGTYAGRVETATRASWALLGPQWERRSGGITAFVNVLAGVGGSRTDAETLEGLAFEPDGRPASRRGFAWGAGAGLRRPFPRAPHVALTCELAWREMTSARWVAAPPFENGPDGPRYRAVRGRLRTLGAHAAVEFTRP